MLHVERRAILGLVLSLLSIQTAVHATVAILCEKCVDGLYSGLSARNKEENVKLWELCITIHYLFFFFFSITHHDRFSLKCFHFLPQVLVRLEEKQEIHDAALQLKTLAWGKLRLDYLLSIRVWLECDVPVVVVRKLNTYHLRAIVIFEQWLHFLWKWQKNHLT